MDPLTHTLVGANLASSPLGRKTRFAAAALIVGANLPDVDAILYFTGHSDLALGFRRGWTHGVLALLVLPLLLTGVLLLLDRHRRASPRWLLILSFLAVLTHPVLDWLNNYGMRWLMPFRGTWFYGDSVYIMDPWVWLILGCGWLAGRRPSRALIVVWACVAVGLAWVVGQRSPSYLIVVAIVAVVTLAALLWRSPRELATPAVVIAFAYIAARLLIHEATEVQVRKAMRSVDALMVAPQPLDPTRWDVVARTGEVYRYGRYTWRDRRLTLAPDRIPVARESPEWAAARRDPSIRGFMTWVRFPWYEVERTPEATRVLVHDARYLVRRRAGGGFGGVVVTLPHQRPSPATREKVPRSGG